jgi:hypothetical protein
MEADVRDLLSQATAMDQISNARADQLLVEVDVVAACGKNDVKKLKTEVWAVQQRGDAQYSKLTTESSSVASSQEALALQIDAQVNAAGRHLNAELAKIDNSLQAAERIAQADHQQAITHASVLRQKTEAAINRTNAQFTMEHAVSRAQIQRDKELALSQSFRGDAACDRLVADATSNKTSANANIYARHAEAQADMDIILASNSSKREAAQAHLDAVKARFNARIEQVKAERVIDMAEEYNQMAVQRTDLASALSQARAAREESNIKLSELQKRQAELQTASMENWSEKLAQFKTAGSDFQSLEIDLPSSSLVEAGYTPGN